jgi:hypothetical protein
MKRTLLRDRPASLWHQQVCHLPKPLVEAYRRTLEDIGELEEAQCGERDKSELIGGADERATRLHFAHRFEASAVRLQYLSIDPQGQLSPVSNDLLLSLTEGRIAVLDVPSGTGASLLGLLSTLAALREATALPTWPLTVYVCSGDISPSALSLYDHVKGYAADWLELQAIRLEHVTVVWDASRGDSTAELLDAWLHSIPEDVHEYLVLFAAFSGEAGNHFKRYQRSFEQIAERLHDKPATLLHVEPKMSGSTRFFDRLSELFSQVIAWFAKTPKKPLSDNYYWFNAIRRLQPRGTISVLRYIRALIHE